MRFATAFAVLFSGAVAVVPATSDATAGTDIVTVVVANGESLTYLDVPANHVNELIADGGVVAVAKPSVMAASSWPSNDAYATDQWAIPAAGFDSLPDRADGTGIVVAVIDTGVRADHQDLVGRVSDGGDYVSDSSKTLSDPGVGHGTHVAGIIAAKRDNGVGVAGGAPGVTIIAYRVLGATGGSAADVAAAITAAVDAGAKVINLSLGGQSNNAVTAAVANAVGRGTLVVAAAGNGGLKGNTPEWPGADPNAIGVGATMDGGALADFSTTGPQLDLAAPGEYVWSTYNKSPSSYVEMSGTSMASPYVAAAAAAIWSAHPEATATQVREALETSATDLGIPGRDDEYGAGQVNAADALVALDDIVGRAPDRYTTVEPFRVFDTRVGGGVRNVARSPISADNVLEVRLTDLAGVIPTDDVAAVSLNVTVTNTANSGFATVYPCGTRPNVSSLNFPAGGTVANAVITPVSATGTVCFFSSTVADLLVDVNGWYPAGSGYHAPNPIRVFDTRVGATGYRDVARHSIDANHPLEVQITDIADTVPRTGVAAVSLNVTAVNTTVAGYLTVYPCGARPDVSSVNFPPGGAVANAVLTPVSATGTVCFASSAPADVLVDVNGWFSASGSSYRPTGPQRLFDTRSAGSGLRPVQSGAVGTTYILVVPATGLGGYVPATGVAAVSLNVTATGSAGDGYVTVYPCRPTPPDVSSLNYRGGTTVANAVIVPVAANGTICLYSYSPTQLIADVNGWFAT